MHLLLHASYSTDQQEALEDDSGFRELDNTTIGGQLRIRGPKIWTDKKGGDFAFGFEADYINKNFKEGEDDEVFR